MIANMKILIPPPDSTATGCAGTPSKGIARDSQATMMFGLDRSKSFSLDLAARMEQ